MKHKHEELDIGGVGISIMSFKKSVDYIVKKVETGEGLRVCFCTLNEIMEAQGDEDFSRYLQGAGLKTADGMPLVWYMRWKIGRGERVYGPEVMKKILELKTKILKKQLFIGDKKNEKFFSKIGKYLVLPYKEKFEDKDYQKIIKDIKRYDSKLVWIGLGAKKQVIVSGELYKRLNNRVYLCVGAAFDFLSGNKRQCPRWLRNAGGEWLFRWINEPRRLTKRYFKIIWFLIEFFWKKFQKQNYN
jgi:N-acetylglucosaminyldiphosphoundecaprenol N-acetyl-beta-D-mannosaminyltransferase